MDKIDRAIKQKNERISKFVSSKESSIKQSSIMRDSALFTASRLETWKNATQADFIEEYRFWRGFFEKEYNAGEKAEIHSVSQEDYKKDPLNSLDLTPEEAGQLE